MVVILVDNDSTFNSGSSTGTYFNTSTYLKLLPLYIISYLLILDLLWFFTEALLLFLDIASSPCLTIFFIYLFAYVYFYCLCLYCFFFNLASIFFYISFKKNNLHLLVFIKEKLCLIFIVDLIYIFLIHVLLHWPSPSVIRV